MVDWHHKDVAELLGPLTRHRKVAQGGRNRGEEALKLISKSWDPAISAFFRARQESARTPTPARQPQRAPRAPRKPIIPQLQNPTP